MAKRCLDILVSAAAIAILSPLILCIALSVAVTSNGGPLFRQIRMGIHGRRFTILKFRSMTVSPSTHSSNFTPGQTTRVTGIGRILRKTKLDELPQLWNVLRGDMSLVGPRPEVPEWTDAHPERWKIVLSVRPGITDPASIEFRDEESMLASADDPEACYRDVILPRKLDLSEAYVRERSFLGDLAILARTLTTVLGGRDAGPEGGVRGECRE
ncbi:MAG: hypothetical protein CMJ34_13200 [Phycisphaerae bacterium]|nr:hypothetical protein [Phycisphaerae bacterium]